MIYPTYEQAMKLASDPAVTTIPLSMQLYADCLTPIMVLRRLKRISSHCFLLESVESSQNWGRYSFLGFDPVMELTCKNGQLQIRQGEEIQRIATAHPKEQIRQIMRKYHSPKLEGMPPFTGGLVGYFAYDYMKYSEPTLALAQDPNGFPDVDLMLFDKVIAFDHFRQKISLIVNLSTQNMEDGYPKAEKQLREMAEVIQYGNPAPNPSPQLATDFQPLFSQQQYCHMVEQAKRYIYEGDIFQVVLSNQMQARMSGSLLDVYRVLRTQNPSPYMFYFTSDSMEFTGASPETLVTLKDGTLYTFPLAGTRPRGATLEEDLALEQELLSDEKELAEHNMLVDLGRNDIGRISQIGSVHVEKYLSIQRFSHVMHIGSTVCGRIRPDRDALDAVDSILPAGTLSGAPKLRACQIIQELEAAPRGIYGGAIGYLDFSGNLDTCIAIRLAYLKDGVITVRSGAGIVADSIPENEYQECINKAKAVIQATREAEKGLTL